MWPIQEFISEFFPQETMTKKKKSPDSYLFFVVLHLLSSVWRTENSSSGPSEISFNASTKLHCLMQCITGWEQKRHPVLFSWNSLMVHYLLQNEGTRVKYSGSGASLSYFRYRINAIIQKKRRLATGSKELNPLDPQEAGLNFMFQVSTLVVVYVHRQKQRQLFFQRLYLWK